MMDPRPIEMETDLPSKRPSKESYSQTKKTTLTQTLKVDIQSTNYCSGTTSHLAGRRNTSSYAPPEFHSPLPCPQNIHVEKDWKD